MENEWIKQKNNWTYLRDEWIEQLTVVDNYYIQLAPFLWMNMCTKCVFCISFVWCVYTAHRWMWEQDEEKKKCHFIESNFVHKTKAIEVCLFGTETFFPLVSTMEQFNLNGFSFLFEWLLFVIVLWERLNKIRTMRGSISVELFQSRSLKRFSNYIFIWRLCVRRFPIRF